MAVEGNASQDVPWKIEPNAWPGEAASCGVEPRYLHDIAILANVAIHLHRSGSDKEMRESEIQRRITNWLKSQNDIFFFKVHGSRYQQRGLPDLVGNVGPVAFYMEIKQPGKELRKLQAHIRDRILQSGGSARRIESLKEAQDFILALRRLPVYHR